MLMNRTRSLMLMFVVLAGCQGRESDAGVKRSALTVTQASARTFATVAAAEAAAPETPKVAASTTSDAPRSSAPKARSAAQPASLEGKLKVKRLVVASGVEKREPVGAASTFSAKDASKIYGFVELENPEKAEGNVFLSFEQGRAIEPKGNVKLAVGASPRWRTWGFSRAVREAGSWSVVVRDEAGTELARERFEVTL